MTPAGTEFAPLAPGRVRVVFVHGFLDDAGVWDDVIARLPAPAPPVDAIDLAGMGSRAGDGGPYGLARGAEDVAALVDQAEGPVVLVGQSMGAQVAELAAALRPDSVAGLVLVAPVPLGGTGLPEEAVAPFKALGGDEPAQRAVRQQLTASLTGPALDRLVARGLPSSPRAVAAFVDAWNAGDRRGDAPTVFAGPVVIVSGEADGFCTAEMIEGAIVPRFPGAEHVVVAGTGHWPHAEQPEAVAAAISALLTRVAAGGS